MYEVDNVLAFVQFILELAPCGSKELVTVTEVTEYENISLTTSIGAARESDI